MSNFQKSIRFVGGLLLGILVPVLISVAILLSIRTGGDYFGPSETTILQAYLFNIATLGLISFFISSQIQVLRKGYLFFSDNLHSLNYLPFH